MGDGGGKSSVRAKLKNDSRMTMALLVLDNGAGARCPPSSRLAPVAYLLDVSLMLLGCLFS